MTDIYDASMLWGTDQWARDNRPDLASEVNDVVWSEHKRELSTRSIGLAGGLVMPFPSAQDRDFGPGNTRVIEALRGADMDAFGGVLAVRPGDAASVANVAELAAQSDATIRGIKLWPYLGNFDLDAILADAELQELVRQNKWAVLMHVGNGRERESRPVFPDVRATPEVALRCAEAMPDVPVVIAHVARLCESTLARASELPNLFIDLSGLTSLGRWLEGGRDGLPVSGSEDFAALGPTKILERLVTEYGLADRILFGSTWPFCTWWGVDLYDDVDLVRSAKIGASERDAIFAGNFKHLFE